jgi:hypothetical protein
MKLSDLQKLGGWSRLLLVGSVIYWLAALTFAGASSVQPGPSFWEKPWPPEMVSATAAGWTFEAPPAAGKPKLTPVDYDPFARHINFSQAAVKCLAALAIYSAMAALIWAIIGFRRRPAVGA